MSPRPLSVPRNRRRLALASALVAFAPLLAGAAETAPPAPERAGPCSEEILAPLRSRVERLRGFSFVRTVPCRVEDGAALASKIRSEWDRKSPAEWDAVEARFRHFGLLPAGRSLRDVLLPVLDEQVAAYYDQLAGILVIVRRDGDPLSDEADLGGLEALAGDASPNLEEMTLLHELDHALADQRAGLAAALDRRRGRNDAENAFVALIEGEAVWTMMAGLVETLGGAPEDLGDPGLDESLDRMESLLGASIGGGALADAPPAIREALLFPYLRGFRFARDLHNRGGRELLEAALLTPPESTRSILHPESWGVAPEELVRFSWPSPDPLIETGWSFVEDETYGEQDLAIVVSPDNLEHGRSSTSGWRGDRWRLYRNRAGKTAVAGITEWADDTSARLFELAIHERLHDLRPGSRRRGASGRPLTTPGGAPRRDPVVTRRGKRVVVVDGARWFNAERMTAALLAAPATTELCPPL